MKLLFMDREDVFNTWGQLRFRAAVLEQVAELEPDPAVSPDFTVRCCVPQVDGSYVVYACDGGRDHKPWQIYRYRTDDGIHLQAKERVYQSEPGRWSQTTTLNYSPEEDLFLCLKNMKVDDGGSTYAYLSRDGERWDPCPANPVYVEGDRWGCVWSSAVQRFITYNKGIQRYAGKLTPELLYGGVGLSERWDARRVVTIRTSRDGCRWEPDHPDWSRRGTQVIDGVKRFGGPAVPPEYQITPDDQDPPDLEFYAGYVFEYEGRYFMNMMNYAPSLLPAGSPGVAPGGHGPQLDSEWWISRDGLRWERPFRGTNTIRDRVAFIQHNPMVVDGQLLFHQRDLGRVTGGGTVLGMAHEVWGVPQDRLTGVTSRSNAVFETTRFAMPRGPLKLNAKIPGDGYLDGRIQAFVMAELIDDCDRIIPGYERHRCRLLPPQDSLAIKLDWQGRTGAELAGRAVRIRFFMRGADLFAVTA